MHNRRSQTYSRASLLVTINAEPDGYWYVTCQPRGPRTPSAASRMIILNGDKGSMSLQQLHDMKHAVVQLVEYLASTIVEVDPF